LGFHSNDGWSKIPVIHYFRRFWLTRRVALVGGGTCLSLREHMTSSFSGVFVGCSISQKVYHYCYFSLSVIPKLSCKILQKQGLGFCIDYSSCKIH
jgi:hypothetical protein